MNFDLVFEGGGAKGMVFVGAMQEFMAKGHTYDRLLGTSAGAITATLLAAGYTPQEMLAALNEKENGQPVFVGFMGPPLAFDEPAVRSSATLALLQAVDFSFVPNFLENGLDEKIANALIIAFPNLFSLIELGGWFSAHKFIEWLQRKLAEGSFQGQPRRFSEMTLSQFFAATRREISLVTSDTTGMHLLVLNHRTAPDLPVVWAVRMSMSIPLVWPEVEWQAEWGRYQNIDITGHKMVDGGILSNFPIELFVSPAPHITAVMGDKQSEHMIGLLIDETIPVPGAPLPAVATKSSFSLDNLQMVQRINRLINTATGAHDKMVIEDLKKQVVHLPAQGYGTTEFDMSDARREALVKAGRTTMQDYLSFIAGKPFSTEDLPAQAINHANRVAGDILRW
jgi:NTE family protein